MLPPEILTFLGPPGRILLVKGAAGTGKTLFAMALAEQYQFTGGDVLWAASRHSDPSESVELERMLPSNRLHDLAPSPTHRGPRGTSEEDEPGTLQASDDLLGGLAAEIAEVEDPLVVIDSMDGLVADERPGALTRLFVQAVGIARDSGARLAIVTETGAPSPVDHLADGIVVMEERVRDGMRERWATLRKMRGISLERPVYPFSLAGGRFSAFVDEPLDEAIAPIQPPPRAASRGRIATAVAEWDRLLGGGLQPGTVHRLEVDDAATGDHQRLMVPLVLNAMSLGWSVVHLGAPNEPRDRLVSVVSRHRPSPGPRGPLLHIFDWTTQPQVGTARERFAPLERIRREAQLAGPVLSLLHDDGVAELIGGQDTENPLFHWCRMTRSMAGADVLIGTHHPNSFVPASLADDRWRLERPLGAPVFRGIRPATAGYFVRWRNHKGYPETRLEPIQ